MAKLNSVQGKLRKGGGKGLSGDALVGKVSQSTIDSIKKMGMTEALKLAGKNGATAGGAAREFQEGVRRMYGAKRLATAKATYAPKAKLGTKTVLAPAGSKTVMAPKSAPKSNLKSNLTKGVGAAAAIALAAKGGPAGRKAAVKLAPGFAKSTIGKALLGSGKNTMSPAMMAKYKAAAGPKTAAAKVTVGAKGSFGPTTKSMAKSKLGTPSEYAAKAAQDSARASVKAKSPDAARAAAVKPSAKPKVKSLGRAGLAAAGAGQTKKK